MPTRQRKDNAININTIEQQIDNIVIEFFDNSGIDINDYTQCMKVPHNILTRCMLSIYNNLFKPSHGMINNQRSLIDYNDIELLTVIANKFIDLSLRFNKSLGLMQFSIMSGIHRATLAEWRDNAESNPLRSDVVKNICECHKMEQINLLNDTPVGALSVANNDSETGLEWSKQQAQQIAQNAIYILPSERMNRLKLDKPQD